MLPICVSYRPLLTVAVTVSPSTGQSFSPVNVTETSLLCFLLSVSLRGDTVIDLASQQRELGLLMVLVMVTVLALRSVLELALLLSPPRPYPSLS